MSSLNGVPAADNQYSISEDEGNKGAWRGRTEADDRALGNGTGYLIAQIEQGKKTVRAFRAKERNCPKKIATAQKFSASKKGYKTA